MRLAFPASILFLCHFSFAGSANNQPKTPGKVKENTPTVISEKEDSPTITLNSYFGKRLVPKTTQSNIGEQPKNGAYKKYANLIVKNGSKSEACSDILDNEFVKMILGSPFKEGDQDFYHALVKLNGIDLISSRKGLKSKYPECFYQLEPLYLEDKVSKKIYFNEGFSKSEKDEKTKLINGVISFFPDVPLKYCDSVISSAFTSEEIKEGHFGTYQINANRDKLMSLSNLEEIRSIHEEDTSNIHLNDAARLQSKVTVSQQAVDASVFPPTPGWLSNAPYSASYYGRGIYIGIYDSGIDTGLVNGVSDFREWNGTRNVPRVAPLGVPFTAVFPGTAASGVNIHGTHVAGIAGGNGWLSESNSGARYQWRGVAPKALFVANGNLGTSLGFTGDVNNHSHTSDGGAYETDDQSIDALIASHSPAHIMVYAAGNSGLEPGNGLPPVGYYSIIANAKNPITVGATYKDTLLRAHFSSMGPTRDGRIKPDIVAPGGAFRYPSNTINPMNIDIDYVQIRRPNNQTLVSWDFNTNGNLENWTSMGFATNLSSSSGALHFSTTWFANWIRNASVNFTSGTNDTLIMRYRMRHSSIPSKMKSMFCAISWNTASIAGEYGDNLRFNLSVPDTTTYQTAKFLLRNLTGRAGFSSEDYSNGVARWTAGTAITSLILGFHQDTVESIKSSNLTSTTNVPGYAYTQGTSMAAPHVTGIIALLLEKWAGVILTAGQNIHNNGPWNSTIKAILIHTATDMIKTTPTWEEARPDGNGVASVNRDLCIPVGGVCTNEPQNNSYVRYFAGPDYSTGYGLVNAQKALDYIRPDRFIQDSIAGFETRAYTITVPSGTRNLRFSVAWDDPAGSTATNWYAPKLSRNLDLVVVGSDGTIYYPWALDTLHQNPNGIQNESIDTIRASEIKPAYKGVNTRDNVEVVDINSAVNLPTGEYRIIVKGNYLGNRQSFSLVSDLQATYRNTTIGWLTSGQPCPEGWGFVGMDDEDAQPQGTASYVKTGYTNSNWSNFTGQYGVWKTGQETRVDFCRETRSSLPSIKNDYAVLRLGPTCPTGSFPFARISDNEDDTPNGNSNSSGVLVGGGISPSVQSTNLIYSTRMEYCFVPGNGSSTTPPWKFAHQGAISDVNQEVIGCSEFHWHVEDDEDNGNGNSWDFYLTNYATRIQTLFNNSTTETHYFYSICP